MRAAPGLRRAAAGALLFASSLAAGGLSPIRPEEAPRADRSVLAALNDGAEVLDVIVGVRDETPSLRALAARPDPAGEPARRRVRRAAQERLVQAMAPGAVALRRHYDGFSMLAARATRDGILALANRRDVAWITRDGVRRKHDLGQAAQRLIHSGEANDLGFDGSGQAIAVLDTGVDYGVAELGGGGFPNAKVVGGADLGDDDADPLDCDGHGTSVAAIAAGPSGVAPGAKIVALKIASRDGCDTAEDSVILAALDWAVAHRDTFHITAANLSFGGAYEDGLAHGYCDEAMPQYAAAVDALHAAGIVLVVSSGNEGLSRSVSVPACLSGAISVGAVYANRFESVPWFGGDFCEDEGVVPDGIVCFSNSAATLSLLAPGAFWQAPDRGGDIEYFHGTSASAPAVAGAAVLARQARPGLSPTAVDGLLRLTGRALTDPRNGVATPRIDALAAVALDPGAFAPFDGVAVPIPDGSGSASAFATVSGFAAVVASVQAFVQIDHDDPRQLTLTLTGPDGTSTLLHDRSGAPQHPINGVYGTTLAATRSMGPFQGRPGNGLWTLTVSDGTPLVAGRIRNFAVRMIAAQPAAPLAAGAGGDALPIVGHVQGSRLFLSDVRIYNPGTEERGLSLFYVAKGLSGPQAVRSTHTIAPGRVLALDDVVGAEFGYADSVGELTVLSPGADLITSSRAYTRGAHGTFGLFVPAVHAADALGPGATATANGLTRAPGFHTNAGFTEVSGVPTAVRMDIFDGDGALLASTTGLAPPNGTILATDVLADHVPAGASNVRIDYTVTSASGRVIPYATVVDDATGDGVFVKAVDPPASDEELVIAQASHAVGASASLLRTDLHVSNLGSQPATVTLRLLPRVLTGAPAGPRTHTLAPGQTLAFGDVLASEFGLADPSAAGIGVRPTGPARLAVSSRTYLEKFGGTFGFAIPGLPASEAIGFGDGRATVIQLDQTASAQGARSNFGFTEVAGADATVDVSVWFGDTGERFTTGTYHLPARSSFQAPLAQLLPAAGAANVYLTFEVTSGAGRVLAYGVAIDNASGDAIYVPARREGSAD